MLKHPLFNEGQQYSIEFIRFLLEDLSRENNKIKKLPPHRIIINDFKDKVNLYNKYKKFFNSQVKTFLYSIFYLQILNKFTFSSGNDTNYIDALTDIPLLLPTKRKKVVLNKLLIDNLEKVEIEWEKNA